MPLTTPRPPAGFPDFRRHADGTLRPLGGSSGASRLLIRLVSGGLDPDSLTTAAALVARLDEDARVQAEGRRAKARRAAEARWDRAA